MDKQMGRGTVFHKHNSYFDKNYYVSSEKWTEGNDDLLIARRGAKIRRLALARFNTNALLHAFIFMRKAFIITLDTNKSIILQSCIKPLMRNDSYVQT